VDVSSPHQPIHSWKDFLLHLLTITIGLFIALTLEAAVEAMHHRHLVREARANLQAEMVENRKLYAINVLKLQLNRNQLAHDIEQLRELRDGRKLDNADLSWTWDWNSYRDAAWKTAHESGAVSYMDSESISTYSTVYAQQDYVNATAVAILNEESRVGAPLAATKDAAKLNAAELESLLVRSAEIDLSFALLQSTTMKALDNNYQQALASP
jgi:hypothetical protein